MYLVGFMGCGKSRVARELAGRLGRGAIDTDALVEDLAGEAIAQIIRRAGEGAFRDLETGALESLTGRPAAVVATGGGVMLRRRNRDRMRLDGCTVWLDIPYDVAVRRLSGAAARPLWEGLDPLAGRILFERRRAVYALADVRVDGAVGGPAEVAGAVRVRLLA